MTPDERSDITTSIAKLCKPNFFVFPRLVELPLHFSARRVGRPSRTLRRCRVCVGAACKHAGADMDERRNAKVGALVPRLLSC